MNVEQSIIIEFIIHRSKFIIQGNMYKYILQSVENINWLAVASLIIFFVIFVVSAMWAFMSKKEFIDKMSKLPLDNEE